MPQGGFNINSSCFILHLNFKSPQWEPGSPPTSHLTNNVLASSFLYRLLQSAVPTNSPGDCCGCQESLLPNPNHFDLIPHHPTSLSPKSSSLCRRQCTMAPLTDQELNDRKAEAKRVIASRTQLAQVIRDQAQQWNDKLQQKDYDCKIPSQWFTPYRALTKPKDKNSELCAAAFVAIEAMQEVRGTFPTIKVHNKELDFPYSETASAPITTSMEIDTGHNSASYRLRNLARLPRRLVESAKHSQAVVLDPPIPPLLNNSLWDLLSTGPQRLQRTPSYWRSTNFQARDYPRRPYLLL